MEVQLKKSKITSSILKQSTVVTSNYNFIREGDVLGWVIYDKKKWIIFYKDGLITRMPFITKVHPIEKTWEQIDNGGRIVDAWKFRVEAHSPFNDWIIQNREEDEVKISLTAFEEARYAALEKGQFYI